MNTIDKKIFELNKTKIFLKMIGAIAILLVAWIFRNELSPMQYQRGSIIKLFEYGCLLIVLAGLVIFIPIAIWKLCDKKPGLIINSEGIFNNTQFILKPKFISWSWIISSQLQNKPQIGKMLFITLSKSENTGLYDPIKRHFDKTNDRKGRGTSVILLDSLKISSAEDFIAICNSYMAKHKSLQPKEV